MFCELTCHSPFPRRVWQRLSEFAVSVARQIAVKLPNPDSELSFQRFFPQTFNLQPSTLPASCLFASFGCQPPSKQETFTPRIHIFTTFVVVYYTW